MRIFIGSSGKHLDAAEKLALYIEELKHDAVLWTSLDVFKAGDYTLESLYKTADEVDAGVFVFAPDDLMADERRITRDNVIFEAGLYYGLKGRRNTAIYVVDPEKTKSMSDLSGVTYIDGSKKEHIIKEKLKQWLDKADGIRHSPNIWMSSRKNIESVYTVEERFSMMEHIREVKFLNFASTTILTPHLVDPFHEHSAILSKKIDELLGMKKYVELIITEPGSYAMKDALTKVRNRTLKGNKEAVFYSAYAGLIEKLNDPESEYHKAYNSLPKKFNYFVTDIALPYSIFITEYEEGYEKYDCIKIDLYSARLKSEKTRRSMYIMKENDPENYDFFSKNYDDIREYCENHNHEPKHRDAWLKKWEEIRTRLGIEEGVI